MLLRYVKDIQMGSADIQSGSATAPFLALPTLDQIIQIVMDNTATTPAAVGKILVNQFTAVNAGTGTNATYGANYIQSATANQAVNWSQLGVVQSAAAAAFQEARIISIGYAKAFATSTANTNKAIAVGDPLCLDGAGNLTSAPATPAAGTVVGFALGALAGATSTPTLIPVLLGGY